MKVVLFGLLITVAAVVGQISAIVKCINSDWKPSYKREIVYGISALTGLGSIVGYFNIPDEK